MKNSYVLGLNCGHDGSVSLVKNRKMVGYIATERLTRNKKERGINKKTIKYILDKEGIKLKDVDCAVITNWFWDKDLEGTELWDKTKEDFSIVDANGVEYTQEDWFNFHQNTNMVAQGVYEMQIGEQNIPVFFVDHHFSHCATSYYLSPFRDAICLSVDFADNMGTSHSVYYFNDDLKFYRPIRRGGDFDIGSFYGSMCDYLGFFPSLTDAGKVMALSAYGKVNENIVNGLEWPTVKRIGQLFHGDQYNSLLYRHGMPNIPERRVFYPQLKGEGGVEDISWLDKKDWKIKINKNIAADTQHILEASMINMIKEILSNVKNTKNICLSGGTVLNCVANGKLQKAFPDYNFFIPPAPGDDGLSIGASIFIAEQIRKNKKGEMSIEMTNKKKVGYTISDTFTGGKIYDDQEIQSTIKEYLNINKPKLNYEKLSNDDIINKITKDISEGKIVAYFEGGSEIGPRALGNRSILADARNKDMKDKLNKNVKHREEFRPFAPMVLKEKAHEWFDVEEGYESPFMLFSHKSIRGSDIPSGVHIDDSGRLQTISEDNGRIYDIIKKFDELTGVPVIINTSFNDKGEPIVETPEDAMKCFIKTEIDTLVMEGFYVTKQY
jgi:carbamoyltransferase